MNTGVATIREYRKEDSEGIFQLMSDVWGKDYEAMFHKDWKWLFFDNPFNPHGSAHIWVSELNSKIIGAYFDIFVDLKIRNKVVRARWGGNFIVHPAHRGKGVRLFKKATVQAPFFPVFGFSDPRAMDFYIKASGCSRITNIYTRLCIINAYEVFKRKVKIKFIAHVLSLLFRCFLNISLPKNNSCRDLTLTEIGHFDERFDEFWQEVAVDYDIIVVRNSKYLNWRFKESPNEYKIFAALQGDRVLGYIVLRVKNNGSVRTAQVIDILAHHKDKKTIDALLDKALDFSKENNCHLVECLILTDKNVYLKALVRHGFLFKKTELDFAGYTNDAQQLFLLKNPKNWFVTNADPDLDI